MNKIIILSLYIFNVLLYAGGDRNTNTQVSQSVGIDSKVCKVDKVYTEKDTQLMWQDQAYTNAETAAYSRNQTIEKVGSWHHAINYCLALDYQGYSDWRLPTADELRHVHYKSGQVFSYHREDNFWTSTVATDNRYYVVFPVDAYQYKRKTTESNYIRCVRCWTSGKKNNLSKIIKDMVPNISERN